MMLDEARLRWMVGLVVVLGLATVGCEGEIYKIQHQGPQQRENDPKFNWHEALRQPPSAARGWLGQMTGCEPERQLPALAPDIKGLFPKDSRQCRFPESEQRTEALYHIDAILYARQTTTAVFLKPTREVSFSVDELERFYLPKLPVVRRRHITWGGGHRRVFSLRMRRITRDLDRGTPIAIDMLAAPDDPERLDLLRVAAISRWPYSIDHVELQGPDPVSEELVLPPTITGKPLEYALSVHIGLDAVEIQPLERFPRRINGDEIEFRDVEFSRDVLSGEDRLDGPPWRRQAEEVTEQWIRQQRNLGYDPLPVPVHVFATQTVPFGDLTEAMEGTETPKGAAFRIGARQVTSHDAAFTDFANLRVADVAFESSGDADPNDVADSKGPRFTVRARTDGLDIWANGEHRSPVEGCPSDGPTFCLDEEVDVTETTREARRLHRNGALAKSEKQIRRVLSAYDWRQLYAFATALRGEHPKTRRVFVRSSSNVPVAVTFRIVELLDRRLAFGETPKCVEAFPDEASFGEARHCTREEEEERAGLFDRPVLVYTD